MPRTPGAQNIVAFEARQQIASTDSTNIRHLAVANGSPLVQFQSSLRNADNFLDWIVERHEALQQLHAQLAQYNQNQPGPGPHGPKTATFNKYRWYAEQLVLLEAINHFEVFFKRTLIALGNLVQEFVPVEKVKGEIDAKVLWSLQNQVSVPSLFFERQLFHDLETIDKATAMLIDRRRYNLNQPQPNMVQRVRSIRTIFQIRHTLSHNAGDITVSDSAKFAALGFTATIQNVIDPRLDNFSTAVFRLMRREATEFTAWLRAGAITFLQAAIVNRGLSVPMARRAPLRTLLGGTLADWNAVAWTP
jgi:hypothetical protein